MPPVRGLPSREAQILKSLRVFVCLLVRNFAEICPMVSAPASSADFIGFIFRAPKTGLRTFELVECVKAISGTLFFDHFFDFCSFEIRLL